MAAHVHVAMKEHRDISGQIVALSLAFPPSLWACLGDCVLLT